MNSMPDLASGKVLDPINHALIMSCANLAKAQRFVRFQTATY
jgi:hypothetical protein